MVKVRVFELVCSPESEQSGGRLTGAGARRLGGTQQQSPDALCLVAAAALQQGWRLHHLSGQPVPMLDNPFSKKIFPNIQSKPFLMQLEAISCRPIASYLGEETETCLATTSFQVVVESDEVSPEPPFLQAKQPQFPQPLPISLVLQTLDQLHCPSLDTLQHLNVSLGWNPKLHTVFEVWPHQCRVQGDDHFPSPAGHTVSDTSQDAIGFLGHLGTLLAHNQAAIDQYPQVLLCQAAFQPLFPKPVALHGVVVTQGAVLQEQTAPVWVPHGSEVLPEDLLQCGLQRGLLSMGHSSCQKPALNLFAERCQLNDWRNKSEVVAVAQVQDVSQASRPALRTASLFCDSGVGDRKS
ncbi:LOW QUALITY PROTEIN: hypothetical protein QYF61_017121 [Mycteria americana]|uniref:Uncharacterized protein n=1 Tax=Mycteria americana TaxID=33587 RepID=A0AAN7RM58_MYCAM|nr:LOW QUALITY PROTEIN: hypothetical protein QYF61_017121 [Mycteria americana]